MGTYDALSLGPNSSDCVKGAAFVLVLAFGNEGQVYLVADSFCCDHMRRVRPFQLPSPPVGPFVALARVFTVSDWAKTHGFVDTSLAEKLGSFATRKDMQWCPFGVPEATDLCEEEIVAAEGLDKLRNQHPPQTCRG